MKPKREIYEAERFKDLREVINNTVKLYPDNIAFIIKHKIEKDITYTKIKYSKFKETIDALGTELIDLGFKDKKIAIIRKK